jgi:hypothetical protein
MLTVLADRLAGERVIAVGSGYRANANLMPPALVFREDDSVIARLQAISAAASDEDHALIPFLVRNTWVIAPETRQEVNLDISGGSAFQGASRSLLIRYVLGNLTTEQVRALGSEDGLSAGDLPKEAQALLTAALRPPIDVNQYESTTVTGPDGSTREEKRLLNLLSIRDPISVAGVRLRATLAEPMVMIESDNVSSGSTGFRRQSDTKPFLWVAKRFDATDFFNNLTLPLLSAVPNTLKPSDLDGRSWLQSIGMSGTHPLTDVLKQLGERTGLRLVCEPPFADVPVFLGSGDIACGELMDAVRLALSGGWRKLGDRYILAWDRRGQGAVQQLAREAAAPVIARVKDLVEDVRLAPAWPEIALTLPYESSADVALTNQQRSRLFGGTEPPTTDEDGIHYDQMTADQQTAVGKMILGHTVQVTARRPIAVSTRPGTLEDVRNSVLAAALTPRVEIRFPGAVWANADSIVSPFVDSVTVRAIRRKAEGKTEAVALPDDLKDPVPIHAASVGLMVPTLTPERVNAVVTEMKRCGLKTLIYPALFDGYATFPTSAFPRAPSLAGADGLAAAAAAAEKAGISLVAYVGTLSWRPPDSGKHWLDAHPDWLDRDILGRTRLEWLAGHKQFGRPFPGELFLHTLVARGYVRPGEPAVRERLDRLVADLAHIPGLAGVAFADWRPATGTTFDNTVTPPPLGFSAPQRLAALDATGWDPVDAAIDSPPFVPAPAANTFSLEHIGPAHTPDPYAALVDTLLSRATAARKSWAVYRLDDPPDPQSRTKKGAAPSAPYRVLSVPSSSEVNTNTLVVPVPSRGDLAAWGIPDELKPLKSIALLCLPRFREAYGLSDARAIIWDFRACPEDIPDALAWLYPKTAAPSGTTRVVGRALVAGNSPHRAW